MTRHICLFLVSFVIALQVPEETTGVYSPTKETTTVSHETTTGYGETTTGYGETTTVSDETTTVSDETTQVYGETTTVYGETTTVSDETTTVSDETTQETTTEQRTEDVILSCSSSSFQVDIPKNLIEGTYVASDFYLSGDPNNIACKGFYNGANYISLNSSLAECGTQYYDNGTHLLYQNMVEIDPSDGNSVVDFLGFENPISCEYNSSAKVHTHFKTLNDVIRKQEKGSFNFDFFMYTDITYSTRYYSYPVETKLNEELYFRAELLRSASNLEIHLRSCRATPSPHYDDAIVYEFIHAGCGINDAPVRVFATNKQTQADFEMKSFRFRKDLGHPDSQVWIHCEVVVCDDSDPDSECRHGCEQPRHRRSAESPPLKTKRMVQGPITLSNNNNDDPDTFTKLRDNGVSGVLTTFLSAVCLVMLVSLVAMGVVLKKIITSSEDNGYQPLPNPPGENVA